MHQNMPAYHIPHNYTITTLFKVMDVMWQGALSINNFYCNFLNNNVVMCLFQQLQVYNNRIVKNTIIDNVLRVKQKCV